MKIRKQVYELTVSDLERFPVWEFALDEEGEEGQDEATVRPCTMDSPFDPASGMGIVKAEFVLADGTRLVGYLTPPAAGDTDLGSIQPQIVTPEGQVPFWCGVIKPERKILEEHYRRLRKSASQVFPIQFRSSAEVVGGPVSGVLEAFLYLELKNERVHRIR